MNVRMFFHIPDIFNAPVGEAPNVFCPYCIEKISCRKFDALEKVLSLCRPLGKEKSAPVMSCRIGQLQLVLSGPKRLGAINYGF